MTQIVEYPQTRNYIKWGFITWTLIGLLFYHFKITDDIENYQKSSLLHKNSHINYEKSSEEIIILVLTFLIGAIFIIASYGAALIIFYGFFNSILNHINLSKIITGYKSNGNIDGFPNNPNIILIFLLYFFVPIIGIWVADYILQRNINYIIKLENQI